MDNTRTLADQAARRRAAEIWRVMMDHYITYENDMRRWNAGADIADFETWLASIIDHEPSRHWTIYARVAIKLERNHA